MRKDEMDELRRWGLLLDVLAEMSDMERQLVVQVTDQRRFLPDELLDRWFAVFRGGRGLRATGVPDHILTLLLSFDSQLAEILDYLPDSADDKVAYIRHDEVWRAVREMADWTLSRIAQMSMPEHPARSAN
jgi:hypothetical protein